MFFFHKKIDSFFVVTMFSSLRQIFRFHIVTLKIDQIECLSVNFMVTVKIIWSCDQIIDWCSYFFITLKVSLFFYCCHLTSNREGMVYDENLPDYTGYQIVVEYKNCCYCYCYYYYWKKGNQGYKEVVREMA